MSRLTDAIKNGRFDGGQDTIGFLDPKYGGNNGYMINLGKDGDYREYLNNAAYIKRPVIPFVIQLPKFFDYMPNPKLLKETLIALLTTHVETIDGLNSTLTVETDSHAIGHAGEVQEEVIKVSRAASTVSMTFREKQGKPINRFFDTYIRYGMLDPDVGRPLVTTLSSYNAEGNLYTPDNYTITMLFVEPDFSHRHVQEAWLVTNMFPKTAGDVTGKSEVGKNGEMVTYTIEFSAITTSTAKVREFAQGFLDKLSVLNTVPDNLPLFVTNPDAGTQGVRDFNTDIDK